MPSAFPDRTRSVPQTVTQIVSRSEQFVRKETSLASHAPQTPARNRKGEPLTSRLPDLARHYQRVLAHDPRNPEALVAMSLVALASRQPESGVMMATAGVTAAPRMGAAWFALGQALKAAGRDTEAERAYDAAIRLDGMNPLARMGMGELKIALDRPHEAIREFELALQRAPAMVPAHLGLGHAFGCMGRFADALPHYERALSLRPRLPEAEFAAGFALARLGRWKEAETRYRRAIAERPDFAAAWLNLGCLLREQGREMYAEAALQRAVDLRPDMIAGWINLALLERDRHNPAQAEAHLRRAFELNSDDVAMLVAWCQFRAAERDMAGAWAWSRWALARDPENHEAVNMHGILLHHERRFAEAVDVFARAEALGSPQAASNRGNSLLDLGRMAEALQAYETAVERDPASPGARYNLALTQLRLGDWKRGWPGYEARWNFREVHRRPRLFYQPRWHGELLDGRRVLLHAEQGLGDTIQFCRYATQVAARGGVPVLEVQAPVSRLLRSLAVVRSGLAEITVLGDRPRAVDLECPLMSLPAVFGTTMETVPRPGAYLGAEPEAIAQKQSQFPILRSSPGGLRIGIAWAGNPRYKADQQRSIKLETLLPLLRTPGMHWISLQKGEPAGQLADLPAGVCVFDGSSLDRDLADTAAIVASLDLIVTTDTCIAHLAGAMAKPVWIMLSHLADWRWMQDGETTPWYPTARLIRQTAPGDWDSVLARIITELRSFGRMERTTWPRWGTRAQHAPAA